MWRTHSLRAASPLLATHGNWSQMRRDESRRCTHECVRHEPIVNFFLELEANHILRWTWIRPASDAEAGAGHGMAGADERVACGAGHLPALGDVAHALPACRVATPGDAWQLVADASRRVSTLHARVRAPRADSQLFSGVGGEPHPTVDKDSPCVRRRSRRRSWHGRSG